MRENTICLLMGLGVGAALGLLLTPKSGEEVRGLIANKAKDGAGAVKARASGLWATTNKVIDEGRSELVRKTEGLKAAFEAGTKAYQNAAD